MLDESVTLREPESEEATVKAIPVTSAADRLPESVDAKVLADAD